ncbi:hypothetical protein, partial [Bosea sp. TAF32]|uniref:hypothetical protein n=1 Tax=Bosea sp. TAF32 TaxID=3237482 RepID=UPI003F91DAD7
MASTRMASAINLAGCEAKGLVAGWARADMRREPERGKTAILAEAEGISGRPGTARRGRQSWTEWLAPGVGATLGDIHVVAASRSAHQQIEIGDSAQFGRIFRLDGRVMSTEADAWIQHELMVHP